MSKILTALFSFLVTFPEGAMAQDGFFPRGVEKDLTSLNGYEGRISAAPGWRFKVDGEYDPIKNRRDSVLATYAELDGVVEYHDRQPVPVQLIASHVCVEGMAGLAGPQPILISVDAADADAQLVRLYAAPTILRGRLDGQLITVANTQVYPSWAWSLALDLADMRHAAGDLLLELPVAAFESPNELNGVQTVRFDTSNLNAVVMFLEAACELEAYTK